MIISLNELNKRETGKHPGQRRQALTGVFVLLLASCPQLWYTCFA